VVVSVAALASGCSVFSFWGQGSTRIGMIMIDGAHSFFFVLWCHSSLCGLKEALHVSYQKKKA
jgi:hypothetical protein